MKFLAAYSQRDDSLDCNCCTPSDDELPKRNALLPIPVASHQRDRSQHQDGRSQRMLDVKLPDISFSAAHFVAFSGFRERLHGHNYTVGIRMGSNQLQDDGYIIDFGDVKAAARQICKQLKEHLLVPALSDVMSIQHVNNQSGPSQNVEIRCEDGSFYSIPAHDCAILPIVHSTAEELSQYFWNELISGSNGIGAKLLKRGVDWLEVSVSEKEGQGATYCADVSSGNFQRQGKTTIPPSTTTKAVPVVAVANRMVASPASSTMAVASLSQDVPTRSSFEIAEAAYCSLLSTLGSAEVSRIGPKTPARAAKAFFELTSGLSWAEPTDHVRKGVFDFDGADDTVAVRDIQFNSLCEHHLLPFSGTAHVVYIPDKKMLGLSKFARLLDVYARRPQVQERLSQQYMQGLIDLLQPKAVLVALEAKHSCMSIRGVLQPSAKTRTTSFGGPLKDDIPTRQLLLQNIAARSSL